MVENAGEKEERLEKIAQQDISYLVWKMTFEACEEAFTQYASRQPKEIRQILYGYADAGRMMQQRKVNLVCEHMEFPKDAE